MEANVKVTVETNEDQRNEIVDDRWFELSLPNSFTVQSGDLADALEHLAEATGGRSVIVSGPLSEAGA